MRHLVLRPNLPVESCHFPGDDDPETFHVGASAPGSDLIVGIASFRHDPLPDHPPLRAQNGGSLPSALFKAVHPYRLRGMAVHPKWRRRRVGEQLLKFGEDQLQERGCEVLWFNAREVAFPFYRAQGYEEASELFSIDGVGLHKVMLKRF